MFSDCVFGEESFLNALRITTESAYAEDVNLSQAFGSNWIEKASSIQGSLIGYQMVGEQFSDQDTEAGLRGELDETVDPVGFNVESICSESVCDPEAPLNRFRNSFFQGVGTSYSSIGSDPDADIVVRTIDVSASFAIPMGSMENVISITPYFRADLLQAAAVFDVPDALYDTGVKTLWRRPLSERLGSMVLVTPSVRSDFQTSEQAFRLFGLGLLTWQWVPQRLSISGGAVYTGRADYPVLPAMGLLWTPTPGWKYDIQFPSPRIAYRIAKNGCSHETWGYVSGVFGGNTWAVKRAGGVSDELTLSDLRLVLGLEHLQPENRSVFVEAGYVFNRSIEYRNVAFQQDLDSALMLRMGVSF